MSSRMDDLYDKPHFHVEEEVEMISWCPELVLVIHIWD